MVDVGAKEESERRAVAEARCGCRRRPRARCERGDGPKGEVLGIARLAGIQAAKQTGELIPLAHPLPLTFVDVAASVESRPGGRARSPRRGRSARTGVEMEAMTAAAVAALTVYDMVKGSSAGSRSSGWCCWRRAAGASDWRRDSGRRADAGGA